MKKIETNKAAKADAILSQAILSGNTIYVAGQIHADTEWKLVGETTAEKFEQIMQNISAILEAAGATAKDIVKVVIYVTDMALVPEINEVYANYFGDPLPVREAIGVAILPLGASIEVSVIAEIDND